MQHSRKGHVAKNSEIVATRNYNLNLSISDEMAYVSWIHESKKNLKPCNLELKWQTIYVTPYIQEYNHDFAKHYRAKNRLCWLCDIWLTNNETGSWVAFVSSFSSQHWPWWSDASGDILWPAKSTRWHWLPSSNVVRCTMADGTKWPPSEVQEAVTKLSVLEQQQNC